MKYLILVSLTAITALTVNGCMGKKNLEKIVSNQKGHSLVCFPVMAGDALNPGPRLGEGCFKPGVGNDIPKGTILYIQEKK